MLRVVVSVLFLVISAWSAALCKTSAPATLTGTVSSDAEGRMEGVVVSAKQAGGTITVSVVTDKKGLYVFPAGRLAAGEYELKIRAIGYEAANRHMVATVSGKGTSKADIKLNKTDNLAPQLNSAEWLMSIPGTPEQKQRLLVDCVLCHSLTPVLASTYHAAEWPAALQRMWNWSVASSFNKPVPSPAADRVVVLGKTRSSSWLGVSRFDPNGKEGGEDDFAEYLSSINLSSGPRHNFELKTLPRPRGEDTKVIVTEYDLPRADSQPHEAVTDAEGMVWYSDFAEGVVGRLDPHTGKVKEWQDPLVKPGYNGGFHDLELDSQGNPWVGRHEFNGFAKFDKKTEKFENWSIPQEYANPRARTNFLAFTGDGKVWIKDNADHKAFTFDPVTGKFVGYKQFPDDVTFEEQGPSHHNIYGMNADSRGNEYAADIDANNIVRIDLQTGKSTVYPIPTPNSGARRMHFDSEDRLWIGESFANMIAMFDTKTRQFQEWPHPIPWYSPYDVARDKDGNVWTGGMPTDLITRFNPKTKQIRTYLLPLLDSNVRRVHVDDSGARPIFWVGENHQAKIAKVEPLE